MNLEHIGLMKLQQLRCLTEVARREPQRLRGGRGAPHLPARGVEADPRLEDELGHRRSSSATASACVSVTEPGKAVIAIAERILSEAQNLRRAGEEFANDKLGTLTIAATHTQARYALPKAVAAFKQQIPQGRAAAPPGQPDPDLRAGARRRGRHGRRHRDDRAATRSWSRCRSTSGTACVVVPPKHPLLKAIRSPSRSLAEYPIVTYDFAFANRSLVQKAFESRGLKPHVVLSAQDSDVIKTYVELGLGVGILAKMAFDPKRDRNLRAIDAEPSLRVEHHPPGHQARRLPAALRLRVHRAVRAAAVARRGRAARWSGEAGSRYELEACCAMKSRTRGKIISRQRRPEKMP